MWEKKIKLSACIALFYTSFVWGQNLGNSPYSQFGIGDISGNALVHQEGMGGIGAGFSSNFYINVINPAFLSQNRNTIFEGGASTQLKFLSEGNANQRDFGGSIKYLAFAFPVNKRLSASFGLSPYSSVNFENRFTKQVNNSDFNTNLFYKGKGGFSKLYLALGMELLGNKNRRPDTLRHRLSLGVRANYLFGAITNESLSQLVTQVNGNQIEDERISNKKRTSVADFLFAPGIAYVFRLNKRYKLSVGAVYELQTNLNAKRFEANEVIRNDDVVISTDTVSDNQAGEIILPGQLKFGIGIEKDIKWAISAEYSVQDWNSFRLFDEVNVLGKSNSFTLGGYFIPDFTSISKGFWRRTIYRAGINYTQTPITVNNENIKDLSVSLGFSIPFSRGSTLLNFAFTGGRKGTTNQGLVKEDYMRFNVGVTINDLWFIKRKFD